MRIVFMGTPDFAVESLKTLIENKCNVVAVITAPDRPAGRGQQLRQTPVKEYAASQNIPVLQPEKLRNPEFIEELKAYKADLQIVVAFRMLPEIIWTMPPKGTFNLHGSLLPQYRGAAPINWAIIHGEKETGVTTFFIEKEIDTGSVLFFDKISIPHDMSAGELHDKMMVIGANLVLKTVIAIENNSYSLQNQNDLIPVDTELRAAPKIHKETCEINWNEEAQKVYNHIRGLSPYPAAWTNFKKDEKLFNVKIYASELVDSDGNESRGQLISDNKTFLHIAAKNGLIAIKSLQFPGKKRITIEEFLRGYDITQFEVAF